MNVDPEDASLKREFSTAGNDAGTAGASVYRALSKQPDGELIWNSTPGRDRTYVPAYMAHP